MLYKYNFIKLYIPIYILSTKYLQRLQQTHVLLGSINLICLSVLCILIVIQLDSTVAVKKVEMYAV